MHASPRVVVACLVALQVIGTLAWIGRDQFPSGFDCCEHLLLARIAANDLDRAVADDAPAGSVVAWAQKHRRNWTRSTVPHQVAAPLVRAWPGDDAALLAALAAVTSLGAIGAASYAMAARLAGPTAGVLASALALAAPGVWGSARSFGMDLPLAATVAALGAWLVVHPPWASVRATVVMGLAAGAGTLVKAQLVFWVPWLALASLAEARLGRRAAVARLALFGAAAALGSSPFWAGDLAQVLADARWHAVALDNPHTDVPGERLTARALLYYPAAAMTWLGYAAWPVAVAGLWSCGRGGDPRRAVPAAAIVGALLVHTAIAVKHARYLLPAVPLLAVLAAVGAARLGRGVRVALATLALLGGITAQFVGSGEHAAWSGLGPDLARPPVESTWREETRRLARSLGRFDRPGMAVGVEGSPDWGPDDFGRLLFHLGEWLPTAELLLDSTTRTTEDRKRHDAARERIAVRILVVDPTRRRLEKPPDGWLELYRGALAPVILPVLGEPTGPPAAIVAWVRY